MLILKAAFPPCCIFPSFHPQSGLVRRFTRLSTGEGGVVAVQGTGWEQGTGERRCPSAASHSHHTALPGLTSSTCWPTGIHALSGTAALEQLCAAQKRKVWMQHRFGYRSQPSSISSCWGWGQPRREALPGTEIRTDGSSNLWQSSVLCCGLLPAWCLARRGRLATVTTKGFVKNPESKLIAHKCHP